MFYFWGGILAAGSILGQLMDREHLFGYLKVTFSVGILAKKNF